MNRTIAAIAVMAMTMPLTAQDGPTLSRLTFGKAILGTSYTKEDLKGKLLLVEEFGFN